MITYVPYQQIDRAKYDNCVRQSSDARIYALSWYLDCVTDCWDIFMEGDYQTVMPLPKKSKYGIQYVYTPSWVQQLGLFSLTDISKTIQEDFLKRLSNKFLWIDYHFNSGQQMSTESFQVKKNYVLDLEAGIDQIQFNFNTNRKRISKKKLDDLTIDKKGSLSIFLENYRHQEKSYPVSDDAIDRLARLYQMNPKHVHVWNVFNGGEFMAGLIWLKDNNRITYLVPIAHQRAKKMNVPTHLINELIGDYQGQKLLLDFEGSMLQGVEKFYQSFGADTEFYYYFKKRFINHG